MRFGSLLLAVAAVALSANAWAGEMSPKVGDEAPTSIGGAKWIANAPETDDLAALRGSVVLIDEWGIH
jgi:hypothetical protein